MANVRLNKLGVNAGRNWRDQKCKQHSRARPFVTVIRLVHREGHRAPRVAALGHNVVSDTVSSILTNRERASMCLCGHWLRSKRVPRFCHVHPMTQLSLTNIEPEADKPSRDKRFWADTASLSCPLCMHSGRAPRRQCGLRTEDAWVTGSH